MLRHEKGDATLYIFNSDKVHFGYEMIHDVGQQVSSCLIWVETANLARRHKPPSALIGALKEVLGGNENDTASYTYSWLPSLDSGLSKP